MDVFKPDFPMGEEEILLGQKTENFMKEFQTFTDFEFSQNKLIAALDWQPGGKGVVGVACLDPMDIDERLTSLQHSSDASVLLIWDFVDPIHPQKILEPPCDIFCFQFHPHRPQVVVAGCINGQIAFWNLEDAETKEYTLLKAQNSSKSKEEMKRIVEVTPFQVSSDIDKGHSRPVAALQWMTLGKLGASGKFTSGVGSDQCVTVAGDGRVLIWDISGILGEKQYSHWDLVWSPLLDIRLLDPRDGFPLLSSQIYFIPFEESFRLFISTEEGDIFESSWDNLAGKSEAVVHSKTLTHFGTILSLRGSPFFPDIFLSGGDWTFNLWSVHLDDPLLTSPSAASSLSAVLWSPTRPGVIFVGRSDGNIDIWDFMDKSHAPSLTQHVTSSPITSMEFLPSSQEQVQLLAIGDTQGRLHILEVPRSLARKVPQETTFMQKFFLREAKRVEYIQKQLESSE